MADTALLRSGDTLTRQAPQPHRVLPLRTLRKKV